MEARKSAAIRRRVNALLKSAVTTVAARRARVIALLDAISNLHHDDLLLVLALDEFTPLANDLFELDKAKSLKDAAQTPEALAGVFEYYLEHIIGFADATLPSYEKPNRDEEELGCRLWGDEDEDAV